MLLNIDKRRKVIIPGDKAETITYAANHFISCAKDAIKKFGTFFVALSGGSTPKSIFETLAKDHQNSIDWEKVFLFWSDERAVGPDSPESNYKMAMESGFSKLNLNKDHIFRMKGEGDIVLHAKEYEEIIKKTLGSRQFDLIMLGVGEDGHTASLFPNTEALKEETSLVVANQVPQKNCYRMTFTYPLINVSNNITFYAIGASKQKILHDVLTTNLFPASSVGTESHLALWICDSLAANFLIRS